MDNKTTPTAHNKRYTLRRPFGRLRGSVRLGHFVPTPHSTHIFAVAGTLRVPLSQPQKRRIPRTLSEIGFELVRKYIKNQCKMDIIFLTHCVKYSKI